MKRDPLATVRNAVSNASRRPVSDAEIASVMATGTGAGHVVRSVFGDCPLDALLEAAHHAELSTRRLLAAYATARTLHAAAHAGLDILEKEAV